MVFRFVLLFLDEESNVVIGVGVSRFRWEGVVVFVSDLSECLSFITFFEDVAESTHENHRLECFRVDLSEVFHGFGVLVDVNLLTRVVVHDSGAV
uniref:AlNc14C156G7663 protein n=1 Tax=Albugo laibachii Nc14 TaxID=890382 RepID=F0WMH3_9STRA|nr:AlNc14C156G7663 [Albugo laibachii Nc14]|eukprot:CCA22505.1 AlNc14C156G7663 [Albugo laibachii Nc14]